SRKSAGLSSMSHGTKMPGSALRAIRKTVGVCAAAGLSAATPHAPMSSIAPRVRLNRFVHFLSRADMGSPSLLSESPTRSGLRRAGPDAAGSSSLLGVKHAWPIEGNLGYLHNLRGLHPGDAFDRGQPFEQEVTQILAGGQHRL